MPRSRSRGDYRVNASVGRRADRRTNSRSVSRRRRKNSSRRSYSDSSGSHEVKNKLALSKTYEEKGVKRLGGFDHKAMLPEDYVMQQQLASIQAANTQAKAPPAVTFPVNPHVELFLAQNPVEPHGAARLRALPVEQQNLIIQRSLAGARDPTAVLVGRIRNMCGPTSNPLLHNFSGVQNFSGVARPPGQPFHPPVYQPSTVYHQQQPRPEENPIRFRDPSPLPRSPSPPPKKKKDKQKVAKKDTEERAPEPEDPELKSMRDKMQNQFSQFTESLLGKEVAAKAGLTMGGEEESKNKGPSKPAMPFMRPFASRPKQLTVDNPDPEPLDVTHFDSTAAILAAQKAMNEAAEAGAAASSSKVALAPPLDTLVQKWPEVPQPTLSHPPAADSSQVPIQPPVLPQPDLQIALIKEKPILHRSFGDSLAERPRQPDEPATRFILWGPPAELGDGGSSGSGADATREDTTLPSIFASKPKVDLPVAFDPKKRKALEEAHLKQQQEVGMLTAVLDASAAAAYEISAEEAALQKQHEEALAQYHWYWVQQQLQSQMELVEAQRCIAGVPGPGQVDQNNKRGPPAKGKGGERPSNQPKLPGDWNCPNCGDHQFMRNRMCRACGASRPADAGV